MPNQSSLNLIVTAAIVIAVLWALYRLGQWFKSRGGLTTTVYEWEFGLHYVNGKFGGVLPPGRHFKWPLTGRHDIFPVRRTEQFDALAPVDVTSKDGLVFRMSASVGYRIVDPREAYEESYIDKIRTAVHAAVVKLAATRNLQQLLSERLVADASFKSLIEARICGCEITSAAVQAIVLPPEVRRLFAEIERAKLEGTAALERARGENAALRSLANAAGVLKGNPELMNLRLLQTMASGQNRLTVVVGKDGLAATGQPAAS